MCGIIPDGRLYKRCSKGLRGEIFRNHCEGKLPLSLRLASYSTSIGGGIDEDGRMKTG
jgi:hypothetical protein